MEFSSFLSPFEPELLPLNLFDQQPFFEHDQQPKHDPFLAQLGSHPPPPPPTEFQLELDHPTQQLQAAAEHQDPGLSNLDPLLVSNCNSIDCWIDFTGGESTSSPSTTTDPSLSPTASATTSTNTLITLDHNNNNNNNNNHSWISFQPPPALQAAPPTRASFKRQCTRKTEPAPSSPPDSPSSPLPASSSSSTQPSAKKNQKKKKTTTTTSSSSSSAKTKTTGPHKNARNDQFLERNRLAASRSRAKKKSYQQFLEDQAGRLQAEQARLKQIIADLVAEKELLKLQLHPHHPSAL